MKVLKPPPEDAASCSEKVFAVLVGANELTLGLMRRVERDPTLMIGIDGCFDDRGPDRLPEALRPKLFGRIGELTDFASGRHVDIVYVTLPLVHVPAFDKRVADVLLSLAILLLITPLMLLIALGVKLGSPGPVLFRQRRYGLDGEEIVVYKFRSMTVCEDGDSIRQAGRQDGRVTRFGAFLRRTSLDELPQFINVLQGRMSIVGPRPHAVAHNELYRSLISGYMIRHKVKPGITGWAQVNGLRGETETVEKMRQRVHYDLEYLRNWSLAFDLRIILRTASIVWRGDNAY